jgi:hypothetical protein
MVSFEAIVPFDVLVQFSVGYMNVLAKDASSRQPDLVYLLDRGDGDTLMFLHKHGLVLMSDPLNPSVSHKLYDELGSWSGYAADCLFDFAWMSGSNSLLKSFKTGAASGNYRLECLPSGLRSDCTYMRNLARLGAQWRTVDEPLIGMDERFIEVNGRSIRVDEQPFYAKGGSDPVVRPPNW